jgi:hypothetical protein
MFFKKVKYGERWNMAICTSTESEKIQEFLNQGYEPFGVVSKPVPIDASNITKLNKQNQSYKIIELIYLKQKIIVEINNENLEEQKPEE